MKKTIKFLFENLWAGIDVIAHEDGMSTVVAAHSYECELDYDSNGNQIRVYPLTKYSARHCTQGHSKRSFYQYCREQIKQLYP